MNSPRSGERQMEIQVSNTKYNVEIIYRNRKSMEVQISRSGKIRVLCPPYTTEDCIQKLLKEKRLWLQKHLHKASCVQGLRYKTGDRLKILGEDMVLELVYRSGPPLVTQDAHTIRVYGVSKNPKTVRASIESWCKTEARRLFEVHTSAYAKAMGVQYHRIAVKDQKTRWGSCSSKGNLNFNWRLILAPENILKYVVAHECAHLRHMDHSKAFWDLVLVFDPEARTHRKWLRENGHLLLLPECIERMEEVG